MNCIYCGARSKITREHIWADWLKAYIKKDKTSYTHRVAVIHPSHIDESIKKIDGDPRSRRVKAVCSVCNSGWMSALQTRAKRNVISLASGSPTFLDRADQTALAAWVGMAVMAAEFSTPDKVAISQDDRQHLRLHRELPSNWRVWIAHYVRGDWKGYMAHNVMNLTAEHVPEADPEPFSMPNTQTTTFVVGELFIPAISSVHNGVAHDFNHRADGSDCLIQIWPASDAAMYPYGTITDMQADRITDEFFSLAASV